MLKEGAVDCFKILKKTMKYLSQAASLWAKSLTRDVI